MILVTGGTGLVGSHLLYELAKSESKVKALLRNKQTIQNVEQTFKYYSPNYKQLLSKIEWIEGDILDYESIFNSMEHVTQVYHCAAMVSFQPSDKKNLLQTNIEGTANIVNASLENKIEKFCYVSSVATLNSTNNNELITEDAGINMSKNTSIYSLSKSKAELEIWRGIKEGLKAVIVNPSIILGAGNWDKGSPALFNTIWKGLKYYPQGGMGFVDVKDLIQVMIALMEKEIFGEQYIVSSENCSYKDIFTNIANELEVKSPSIKATKFLSNLAIKLDYLGHLLFRIERKLTKETIRASYKKDYFSNEKIKNTINYNFIPIKNSIKQNSELFLLGNNIL